MSDKKYTSIKHENAAGRVDFDGGKAVWQWAQDGNDSTSILLKSLENPDLALEKTQKTPALKKPGDKSEAKGKAAQRPKRATQASDDEETDWKVHGGGRSGFDPYNRS